MKRIIRRQGKICYHDGFPLYVEQEGFIIPVVHIRRKQESFTITLSYFAPTAFSPRLNPIRHGEGNPIHHKGVDISRGPCDINLRIPKVPGGGGEFLKLGVVEDWPTLLGCFRLALISREGITAAVAMGVV